jgi:hypothetical protein
MARGGGNIAPFFGFKSMDIYGIWIVITILGAIWILLN